MSYTDFWSCHKCCSTSEPVAPLIFYPVTNASQLLNLLSADFWSCHQYFSTSEPVFRWYLILSPMLLNFWTCCLRILILSPKLLNFWTCCPTDFWSCHRCFSTSEPLLSNVHASQLLNLLPCWFLILSTMLLNFWTCCPLIFDPVTNASQLLNLLSADFWSCHQCFSTSEPVVRWFLILSPMPLNFWTCFPTNFLSCHQCFSTSEPFVRWFLILSPMLLNFWACCPLIFDPVTNTFQLLNLLSADFWSCHQCFSTSEPVVCWFLVLSPMLLNF